MPEFNIESVKEIPIMPQVATKILQMQEDHLDISFKELEQIVLLDPALTSKILKVANSALYARQREITSLQQAITLLGFKTIKSLVLLVCASNMYGKSKWKSNVNFIVSESKSSEIVMWRHLVITGFLSRYIAMKLQLDSLKESIFIAGLLHDIGRIVLLMNNQSKYQEYLEFISKDPEIDIITTEENIFGIHHGEVGKIVFQKWNFPNELIDAVSQHHNLHVDSPNKKTVEIVGLANLYARVISNEPLSRADQDLKEMYSKSLSIQSDIDAYIKENFINDIKNDPLYVVSSSLIGA